MWKLICSLFNKAVCGARGVMVSFRTHVIFSLCFWKLSQDAPWRFRADLTSVASSLEPPSPAPPKAHSQSRLGASTGPTGLCRSYVYCSHKVRPRPEGNKLLSGEEIWVSGTVPLSRYSAPFQLSSRDASEICPKWLAADLTVAS